MRILKLSISCIVISAILFVGCSKDEETTELRVHLTDNPYNASAVNVDIQEVKIKLQNEDWISLATHAGVYNLLDYQNGLDTVVGSAIVPLDILQEVRFVLGSRNSIVIGVDSFPLTIPSGSESGLKIKLNKRLERNLDSIIMDFDAALSINQEGPGDFKLRPVIKLK